MPKRIRASRSAVKFLDLEAGADADDDTSEPGASDGERNEDDVEVVVSDDDDNESTVDDALARLIEQRDLLFQWHITREALPNHNVTMVEWQDAPDKERKLINLYTRDKVNLTMPVVNEHILPGLLKSSDLIMEMPVEEPTETQYLTRLRRVARAAMRRSAPAKRARVAKPRAPRAKKARGPSTPSATKPDASGSPKASETS